MAATLTQKWLRQHVAPYANGDRVYADVDAALARFAALRPKSDVYTYDDGRTQLLLCIHGLLPITFRQASYNIPVAVWVTRDYPRQSPIAYVVPTTDMLVKAGKYVDVSGRCNIQYIQNWERKSEGCNISALLEAMQDQFSREPPVYSKPKAPASVAAPERGYDAKPPPPLPGARTVSPPHDGRPSLPPKPGSAPIAPRPVPPATGEQLRAPSSAGNPTPPLSPPHSPSTSLPYPHVRPIPLGAPPVPPIPPNYQQFDHRRTHSIPMLPSGAAPGGSTQPDHRPAPPLPPPLPPNVTPHRPVTVPAPNAPSPAYQSPPAFQPGFVSDHVSPPPPPPPSSVPPPDLLDEEIADLGAPSANQFSPSYVPLPPRPPNPELLRLHAQVHQKLTDELASLSQAMSLDAERLRGQQTDLLKGEPAIRDEMARLEAVRDVCRHVVVRMGSAVNDIERNVAELRRKGDPEVDELVCSTSIVHNQLVNLVAEDNAIEDTIYHLHRALNTGRVDLERFLRTTRVLAEEQFMKRALIEKIQAGMPMSQSMGPTWS